MEEYNYKIKREREISNNEWEDKKREREEKLAKAEKDAMELLEQAKNDVVHMEDLEEKVNQIPELLQKEYEKGKKEVKKYRIL